MRPMKSNPYKLLNSLAFILIIISVLLLVQNTILKPEIQQQPESQFFDEITITSDFTLNGAGSEIDSIAFYEAPIPADTMMFVTGKSNDVVEVWRYPFVNNEEQSIDINHGINGDDVSQELDKLFVSGAGRVSMYSLPDLEYEGTFGQNDITSTGNNENNMDVLKHSSGAIWLYVTAENNVVHYFDAETQQHLGEFGVSSYVTSIEEVLVDSVYQVVYVPDETGNEGGTGSGIYAFTPTGEEYLNPRSENPSTHKFGGGMFVDDMEGVSLYTCPEDGNSDNGEGFIIFTDQVPSSENGYMFFDRKTWEYLGKLHISGVENTDGIATTQKAMPNYPKGLFAAVDNDATVAVVGWDKILTETGLKCLTESPTQPVCGNNIVETGEECDDGCGGDACDESDNGDGCSSICELEDFPGPPTNETNETNQTQPGNMTETNITQGSADQNQTNTTETNTTEEPPAPKQVCGNGILETGELCDDGNIISGDGCSSTCKREVIPADNLEDDTEEDTPEPLGDSSNLTLILYILVIALIVIVIIIVIIVLVKKQKTSVQFPSQFQPKTFPGAPSYSNQPKV